MNCVSFIVFWSLLFILLWSSCDLTNVPKKLKPDSLFDKITWFTDQSQATIDDLHCPKNWSRFLHLCYYLSKYISTVGQANQTCKVFHLNDSRLMYVKSPLEVLYAAHVMNKNNLNKFLIEIDPNLMKDGKIVQMLSSNDPSQWEEFRKQFLEENLNNNIKRQLSEDSIRKDRSYENNIESTTVPENLVSIIDVRDSCQQIKWNVDNEDSNVLILSIESESSQYICSLSNAPLTSANSHLCQYVLDRCENNIACGKHGRCVNGETNFNCSCSFLYTGLFCDQYSHQDIQIIFAIIAMIISVFLIYSKPRELVFDAIQWLINLYRQQPMPIPAPAPPPINNSSNDTSPSNQEPRVECPSDQRQHGLNLEPTQEPYEFDLKPKQERYRIIFLIVLTMIFLLLFFKFPKIDHVKLLQLNHTNSSNTNGHAMEHHRRYTILSINNFIYLLVSGLFVLSFSFLLKYEKRNSHEDDDRSGLVEPIKLLRINDRFQTTAIIVIQMFEILEVLEETMFDIDESAQYGVFAQILKRVFFIILIALQYYPTLASLQFQNFAVRLLTVTYFMGSMIYRTWFKGSAMQGLLFLIKYPQSAQLYSYSFVYGSFRNAVHYGFIGYVSAELIMRLFYDSMYIAWKKGKWFWKIPHRKIEQYSYKADPVNKKFIRKSGERTTNANSGQQGWLNRIRGFFASIYTWDETFRYTTIIVSTYTVAYLFLFHLTGTVVLLYNTPTNGYIRYIKEVFKVMLNIEINEESFQIEVIISAIITTIIYSIQLFLSIKNIRRSMRKLYKDYSDDLELGKKLKSRDIIRKSTQYPSYLLLYLLGGFFLCFHLILFISIIIKRLIFIRVKPSKQQSMIGYILPILVLYFLQKTIIGWLYKGFDYIRNRYFSEQYSDQSDQQVPKIKLTILDSILLYLKLISCAFIGVVASIIRLIISFLVNIIFMPRIDYSYLVEPLRWIDSAHESFRAFLRLEMLIVYPIILEFSSTVTIATNAPIPPGESTGEPPSQDRHTNAQNNDDTRSVSNFHEPTDDLHSPGGDMVSDDERTIRMSLLHSITSNN